VEAVDARARAFVEARLNNSGLDQYPGEKPTTLDVAYGIQDGAISIWPDDVVGWKSGRIAGEWETQLGQDRLAGPVFGRNRFWYHGNAMEMPVFSDGFAAVEGEVAAVIGADAPADKTSYTREEALAMIESVHLGVEVASSPFTGINDFGPLVTISDFGNNNGLIIGAEIADWQRFALEEWVFTTEINGETVGEAAPVSLPGGPLESVRFLLENTARRGLPAKKGMCFLTGAVTGVHQAKTGDQACVALRGVAPVSCALVPATPTGSAQP
jgi:2-keto-4-pentenoate hydratase